MKTKSLIAALLLTASSAFAQVPSYVPTNGLVGWWPFNGNANDESGNGNNGTVNGAILTSDRLGNANKAYSFDGVDDNILVNSNFYDISIPHTISMWVSIKDIQMIGQYLWNTTPHVGEAFVYNWYNTTNNVTYCLGNGASGWSISCGTQQTFLTNSNNIWYQYAMTYNNGIWQIYTNGILLDTFSSSNLPSGIYSLVFGDISPSLSTHESMNGKIDDIGIWNRALTQQEITALYNSQTCNSSSNTITADGPTTFCAGNSVNLKSDVIGGTYQWKKNGVNITTNATSRTYKATATGSYTCVATCNGTALTSNAIQVTSQTNAAVTLSASGATSFCAGDSITLNATNLGSGYSVQWYRTNISMQGSTNYSVVVKQPGTYKTVTKNLANGCSRISSGSIITAVNCRMSNPAIIAVDPVNDEIPATKLGNSTETAMHLFPNPNAGSFTLEYDGIEADFEVQVLNTMGQVIYNDIIPSNDNHLKTTINLGDNMQKGVYVVRIINGEEVHESKVMLQ
jgi:hypothetical protein